MKTRGEGKKKEKRCTVHLQGGGGRKNKQYLRVLEDGLLLRTSLKRRPVAYEKGKGEKKNGLERYLCHMRKSSVNLFTKSYYFIALAKKKGKKDCTSNEEGYSLAENLRENISPLGSFGGRTTIIL